MGNAKPIKKIIGGKREDDISLVVKADTIEGTEESSDVITSAGQEDQVVETETMPVEEETTVETDAVPASDGQTETQETETNTPVSATTNVDDQNQDIAVGEPPRDEEGKDPTHNELVDKVEQTNKDSETVSRDKVVNQVIHYVYENGETAAPDHVSVQLVFTQTGGKELYTGETDWNGKWTETQSFVTVTNPTIEGYTADRPEVGPYEITVTNNNYGDNLDKEDTVIYKKNSDPVVPGPDTPDIPDPDEPKPDTPDPDTPDDPTPDVPDPDDPTPENPDPTPDQEDFTPPLAEEEPGSEYPDQPEKDEEEETIVPKAEKTDKYVSSTVASVKATDTREDIPEAVSTEKTQVTQKEEALPETGEKDSSKAGAILSSLAAALGITGLAGTSKKRKKKDE